MTSNKKALSKSEKGVDIKLLIKKKERVVYSTFRLSCEAHDAIKQFTDFWEEKKAEVFERLLSIFEGGGIIEKQVLSAETNRETKRIRKTYVVKKTTLDKLKKITDEKGVSRDLLIERTALVVKNLIDGVRFDIKERYSAILEKTIKPFLSRAEDIEGELSKELGSDDPVVLRFYYIITLTSIFSDAIEGYLKNGTPIDPDNFSQS